MTTKPPCPDPSLDRFEGLGIFADWKPPSDADLKFAANDLALNDIVLGVWPKDGAIFRPKGWPAGRIREVAEKCQKLGIRAHLMIWAKRRQAFLDSSLDWLREQCRDASELYSVLLDCEGSWHRSGMPAKSAAAMVGDRLDGVIWGVTGLTALHTTVAPIARLASYVVPQAYSFWKPGENHWSHSRSTYPQVMQATAHKSWSTVPGELIMGLGCYWQERPAFDKQPKLSELQTMRACAIESTALEVERAWYWSLKWARGRNASGRAARQFFGARP